MKIDALYSVLLSALYYQIKTVYKFRIEDGEDGRHITYGWVTDSAIPERGIPWWAKEMRCIRVDDLGLGLFDPDIEAKVKALCEREGERFSSEYFKRELEYLRLHPRRR